jgi:hypothetical protein
VVFPTELTSDEEMERNLGEWRRMNVLYECDGLNVCTRIYHINKKSGIMPPNFRIYQINKKSGIMPPNFKMKNIYFLFRCFPTSLAPTCRGFFLKDHTQPASSLAGARLIPRILLAPGGRRMVQGRLHKGGSWQGVLQKGGRGRKFLD